MNTHGFHLTLNFVYDIDLGSMAAIEYCRNVWTSVVPQRTRSIISMFFNNKRMVALKLYIHEFETETHQVIVMYFQNNGHYYQYKYSAIDKSFKKHLNSALLILDSISFK